MSQTAQLNTIAAISSAASDAIFKFQTGKISRDELYSIGTELSVQFNYLVTSQQADSTETETAADFLLVIKHFSTC